MDVAVGWHKLSSQLGTHDAFRIDPTGSREMRKIDSYHWLRSCLRCIVLMIESAQTSQADTLIIFV